LKKMSSREKLKYQLISLVSLILFVFIWWLVTDGLHLFRPSSMASPITSFNTLITKLTDKKPEGATLPVHIFSSLRVVLTGFLAGAGFGIPLGIFMAWNKKFDMMMSPIFDTIRTIPPIAFIPMMIMFLGIGIEAKAAIVFLSSFPPCVLNAYTGIKQTNPVHIWVAQTIGASNGTILRKIAIPTAAPMIFTGLKLSLNTAWMTLVAAELLGATSGLGYMIQMSRMLIRPDIIIVGMLTIGLIGLILSSLLNYLEILLVKGGY